ncbi:MAG: ribbon-helix-helix domain-containing protein [Planctomycetota bacterium]
MVRTQIQLTEQQAAALKRLSAQQSVSMAELIRRAIDAVLRADGGNDPAARRERALAAAGRFHSGRRDLSAKHDDYFTEGQKK